MFKMNIRAKSIIPLLIMSIVVDFHVRCGPDSPHGIFEGASDIGLINQSGSVSYDDNEGDYTI